MTKKRILIADDESSIRDVISIVLEKEDFTVFTASNGEEAVQYFKDGNDFDVVVLDIIMPVMYGTDAAKEIRKYSNCPILFLTAKSKDEDKIEAYTVGGDDYLQKPFSTVELVLRVNALIKRYSSKESKDITFLQDKKSIIYDDETIQLTNKEYALLYFLYERKGEVFDIKELYEGVWNEQYLKSSANTVMVYILNLRKKIEKDYTHPQLIQTVWGKGYCYAQK